MVKSDDCNCRELSKWKNLAEKRRVNEICMEKWLSLEFNDVSLASYFLKKGIAEIILYGLGTLGKLVLKSLNGTDVIVKGIIDQGTCPDLAEIPCYRSAEGLQDSYILLSVMSDVRSIISSLKRMDCRHFFPLEYVIDKLYAGAFEGGEGNTYPELKKFEDINEIERIRVANFGTGMGYYGFRYENFNVDAFNFSMPQQTLEFDYKLMIQYRKKFAPECKVCLVLPFTIFLAGDVWEIFEVNERYYSLLPPSEVEISCNTSYRAYIDRKEMQMENSSVEESGKRINIQKFISCEERRKQVLEILDCWKDELGILSFESGENDPFLEHELEKSIKWFRKILSFCQENHFQPYVIVPPFSSELLKEISLDFRQTFFYNILKENINEDITVLDYSEDAYFCDPSFYWYPCFLTEDKARVFTEDVLQKIGVI